MAVYNYNGQSITSVYSHQELALNQAYDVHGNELLSGEGGGGGESDDFVKTTLAYDTNYIISNAWLANATTQRNALISAFEASNDAIPFFIQTDGHGRFNEGNKACHNLAEPTMGYIRNIQLGDYGSYYSDGANPTKHAQTSNGIEKYISVMGNHEFLNNNSADAKLADLPTLIASYTPSDAVLGSEIYGCYKIIDNTYNVKYLVTQTHIPDNTNSKGFAWEITSEQYDWLIDELEADDGLDIVVLQHEPINGLYATRSGGAYRANFSNMDIAPILSARKAKQNGEFIDSEGITHTFDFTECESDLLCSLHGHHHAEAYATKETFGFPVYVADWFGRSYTCNYGLIDRDNGKLYIWKFSSSATADVLELDL